MAVRVGYCERTEPTERVEDLRAPNHDRVGRGVTGDGDALTFDFGHHLCVVQFYFEVDVIAVANNEESQNFAKQLAVLLPLNGQRQLREAPTVYPSTSSPYTAPTLDPFHLAAVKSLTVSLFSFNLPTLTRPFIATVFFDLVTILRVSFRVISGADIHPTLRLGQWFRMDSRTPTDKPYARNRVPDHRLGHFPNQR